MRSWLPTCWCCWFPRWLRYRRRLWHTGGRSSPHYCSHCLLEFRTETMLAPGEGGKELFLSHHSWWLQVRSRKCVSVCVYICICLSVHEPVCSLVCTDTCTCASVPMQCARLRVCARMIRARVCVCACVRACERACLTRSVPGKVTVFRRYVRTPPADVAVRRHLVDALTKLAVFCPVLVIRSTCKTCAYAIVLIIILSMEEAFI